METLLKKIYTVIMYIGFIFFGGGFLIAFGQFVIYNGMGDFFEYAPANKCAIMKEENKMPKQLVYKYSVNEKTFNDYQNVSTKILEETDLDASVILYNKTFHSFSIIKGIDGKSSKTNEQIDGMILFGIFFLFFFIIYKFTNADRWIGIYTGKYN